MPFVLVKAHAVEAEGVDPAVLWSAVGVFVTAEDAHQHRMGNDMAVFETSDTTEIELGRVLRTPGGLGPWKIDNDKYPVNNEGDAHA